ncbi:hypothetical protein GCM10020331_059780 [Ectobacillus funiculus]
MLSFVIREKILFDRWSISRCWREKQVDGVILTSLRNPLEEVRSYLQHGPIVLVSEYVEDNSLPAVVIDNIKSGGACN